jgi:hypothetical protein
VSQGGGFEPLDGGLIAGSLLYDKVQIRPRNRLTCEKCFHHCTVLANPISPPLRFAGH